MQFFPQHRVKSNLLIKIPAKHLGYRGSSHKLIEDLATILCISFSWTTNVSGKFVCGHTAIDASPKMLELAQRLHPELTGRITLGALPLPDSDVSFLTRRFGAVILIGTIIHVPDQYLFEFASQIRDLVAPDGILFLSGSIRNLPSQENRDEHGRLIIERVPEEIQLLFERLGFQLLTRVQNDDALGRPVKWFTLVMQKAGQGNSRSVDEIETIISRDKKDAKSKAI